MALKTYLLPPTCNPHQPDTQRKRGSASLFWQVESAFLTRAERRAQPSLSSDAVNTGGFLCDTSSELQSGNYDSPVCVIPNPLSLF